MIRTCVKSYVIYGKSYAYFDTTVPACKAAERFIFYHGAGGPPGPASRPDWGREESRHTGTLPGARGNGQISD